MSDISQMNINNTIYNFKDAEGRTQVEIMPAASAGLLGKIYQFVGVTGTYTNGYFYKCVPGSTAGTYEWTPIMVQSGGGGGGGGEILITPRLKLMAYRWIKNTYVFGMEPYHIPASNRNIIDVVGLYETYPLSWDECGIRMLSYSVTNNEINSITFKCENTPSSDLYFHVVSMPVTVIS